MPGTPIITTYAGTGIPGFSRTEMPADRAALNNPFYCLCDRDGDLYIADTDNHAVRWVTRHDRKIRTIAGTGTAGYSGDKGTGDKATLNNPVSLAFDKSGDLLICERAGKRIRRIAKGSGIITTVFDGTDTFKEPHDIAYLPKFGILVADVGRNGVFVIDAAGKFSTLPLPASADFKGIRALAVDHTGQYLSICERGGNRIRRVRLTDFRVEPVAGTGKVGYSGDGGKAVDATLNSPKGVFCDHWGNLYIVETENQAIRFVEARTGTITTVVGGHKGSDGDNGSANHAGLNRPHGVCMGADGSLFVADTENHRIRQIVFSTNR